MVVLRVFKRYSLSADNFVNSIISRSLPNWTTVEASTRMNWFNALVKDLSGLERFFSPTPADKKFLPLLIGAPLANLSLIEDLSQIEALLEIGESLSPVQVSSPMQMTVIILLLLGTRNAS